MKLLQTDMANWQVKHKPFLPTATENDRMIGAQKAKQEGESFAIAAKIEGRVGRGQNLIMEWKYFRIEFGKWHPEMTPADIEEAFDEFHATQNGKWDEAGGTRRVSWKNPMFIDEGVKGHETRTGVKQSAPCQEESVQARARAIDKKIDARLVDSDKGGSGDDLGMVPRPPLSSYTWNG